MYIKPYDNIHSIRAYKIEENKIILIRVAKWRNLVMTFYINSSLSEPHPLFYTSPVLLIAYSRRLPAEAIYCTSQHCDAVV